MLENIQFRLYMAFQAVVCNPEFWAYQYAPIAINVLFN